MFEINRAKVGIVGLGYVGIHIATSFSNVYQIVGYDINKEKILQYQNGIDPTCEVGNNKIIDSHILFTNQESDLETADFIFVTVPTPVDENHIPDLSPLKAACSTIGKIIKKNCTIIFESTVYPGTTRNICIPIIEETSNMKVGIDFYVGYSPERISPGTDEYMLTTGRKIISAIDDKSLFIIEKLFSRVMKPELLFRAQNMEVAEAAKIMENTQRDMLIASMNEFAKLYQAQNIDFNAVLEAAQTKWNFVQLHPGLVGGHCIGVDPYYLQYWAKKHGDEANLCIAARELNESMSQYVADNVIDLLKENGKELDQCRILIYGITYKANVPDTRNSKIVDLINYLRQNHIETFIEDTLADFKEVKQSYNIDLIDSQSISDVDAIIIAVAHRKYLEMDYMNLKRKFKGKDCILVDINGDLDKENLEHMGYQYWSIVHC